MIQNSLKKKVCLFIVLICIFSNHLLSQDNGQHTIPLNFNSGGFKLDGRLFVSGGDSLLPAVILLHGWPGREGDLFGLGQRMCEEGINALVFNYQGMWKSEGITTPETSLNDVKSAIDFLKSPQFVTSYAIDTLNISIVGYSYGGGMALLGSLSDPSIRKVVAIAPGDLSILAGMIERDQAFRKWHEQYLDKYMSDATVARGLGGKATHEWFLERKNEYDLIRHAKALAEKEILLIGGWQDRTATVEAYVLPLYRSLQNNGAKNVKIVVYDTNHSFRSVRDLLANEIISWIKGEQ